MLTKGDDYPIHQTPEPIAFAGTDRNFYDRYFFNGYGPDGEDFFAIAFGIYPNLNVADAHFSCLLAGRQISLHASKLLGMERMDLSVGPISIEIVEPLHRLRIRIAETDGIAADLTFTGRHVPIEEPRFTRRLGPRSFLDYTRLTQNGHWSGWYEVDGRRIDVDTYAGTRDRSWGVRPVGARDPQPVVPEAPPRFFWLWSPVNFAQGSLFFHVNADAEGKPWNVRAVRQADDGAHDETGDATMSVTLEPGARHASAATLTAKFGDDCMTAIFAPGQKFLMRGIGYGHPHWPHGGWKGALAVEREDLELANIVPGQPDHLHIQALARVTVEDGSGRHDGFGILEQLILGAYAPLGLTTVFGG